MVWSHLPSELPKKRVLEGKVEVATEDKEDLSSYWMTLKKNNILEYERVSTRLQCLDNSLWKRLWTCCKTDYVMSQNFRKQH
jgi:hypothetical protein